MFLLGTGWRTTLLLGSCSHKRGIQMQSHKFRVPSNAIRTRWIHFFEGTRNLCRYQASIFCGCSVQRQHVSEHQHEARTPAGVVPIAAVVEYCCVGNHRTRQKYDKTRQNKTIKRQDNAKARHEKKKQVKPRHGPLHAPNAPLPPCSP